MEKLQEQSADPLIGCTLPGGHTVLELIDVGGMGRVYRAEQKMLGRTVAVKIIHPHLLGDETVEARFITEARAASQLNHPNSVGVIDFGKFEGRLYMVMEYIRGRDLATVAHEEGPLDVERIVDVLCQTLAALEEAHHIGIIHRDLKPENIVLAPLRSGGDFVKVLDFGLAKVLEAAHSKRITDPGMVCGTPEYMAPEQARGDKIDHRTDLYACGVLLYELLAGQLPFEGASPREVVLMHLSKLPPDLRVVAPDRDVPPALHDIVAKAMAKDPADRIQTASELARELRAVIADKTEEPVVALSKCSNCGAMMPATQKFCGECGTSMADEASSQLPGPAAKLPSKDIAVSRKLVGRNEELESLLDLRQAAQQSLVSASISGHAGVGRTRLVSEFLHEAEQHGDVVVLTRPDPWWVQRGYYALREAVRRLADLPQDGGGPADWRAASPETRAGLDAIFERSESSSNEPKQRRRWSATPPLGPGEGNRRLLVAEALRWALGQAAQRSSAGRVVLAVDDLDAVDGASRNAFLDVVNDPPLASVLMLGIHRTSFEPGWEGTEQLELEGLPTTVAVTLMVDDDDRDRAAGSVPSNVEQDGGQDIHTSRVTVRRVSPMYVVQLARFTGEGGSDPPPKLADLIALRIERLRAETRRVLQAVAVLGDRSRSAQLVALLPDVQELSHYLGELESDGFITSHDGMVSTSHPLIRDVTLASMPAAVRKRLHAKARGHFGVDGEKIPLEADALHAYFAGNSFEALMLLEKMAEAARGRDDLAGCIGALHMALELARHEMVRGELDDPVGAVLMFSCKLGDALAADGKQTDAEGVLTEALNLAGPSSAERSRILASLANVAKGRGRADAAVEHLDEAVRIAEKVNQPELLEMLEGTRARWFAGV